GEDEILETIELGFNTFTSRRTFTTNVASILIDLPDFFRKLDFSIRVSNIDSSYKRVTQRGQDRNINTLQGNVIINPTPKITITTGFTYSHARWDNARGRDFSTKKIPFTMIWRFTTKSHFFIEADYNWRNYGSGNSGVKFADFHGYRAQVGYRFAVTRRDNLTIKLERSLVEQQYQQERIFDTSTSPISIVASGQTRNNPQQWTQMSLDFTHKFGKSFSATFSPTWQRRRFRDRQPLIAEDGVTLINKHQEVDSILMNISGRYTAPGGWLFGEVSYNYNH
ncbi:MAG: hypothetical protein GY928_34960, partial [Colwellia sp.]|nr:hypothetical protein [Colwellia sp.]